jgi:excisionase family DNA binding protein
MGNQPDAVLTIEELSVYLKIPKSTLYKLVREGKVPSQKVGRHLRFHREAIPEAEYNDLRRIFHVQIRLLLWILCKADAIDLDQATFEQKFGEKVGKWLFNRLWKGASKTAFGEYLSALLARSKGDTVQSKIAADSIWNDIRFVNRWSNPGYGMKFPALPDPWKQAIHDVCIPFYESWLCKMGYRNSEFDIAADNMDRRRIMQAYQKNGSRVCGYCDGVLGDVGTTKDANECEHFFPKSKFPHLCLHPNNLYASCKGCNQTWKADNAPMGVADQAGLYGTYHPQLRPGVDGLTVDVREDSPQTYKLELKDNSAPERVASLNAVLDLNVRWTRDINDRLRSNMPELIAQCIMVSRRHGNLTQGEISNLLDDAVAYRSNRIGKSFFAIREIAVLQYQQAHQLADLLLKCA